MDLTQPEIRVLGCLLEKQRTTPDQYPLSLNSLRLACNQATARDPVVRYDETAIRDALHRLERRGFTRLASGRGSRATKHRHLLAEALPMGDAEQALMCVLMLRGPQTPGELKQRSDRLHVFPGLDEVHTTLDALIGRGLARCLERRPGQKEERYEQLLGAAASSPEEQAPIQSNGFTLVAEPLGGGRVQEEREDLAARVQRLEEQVAELRATLEERVSREEPAPLGEAMS